MSDLKKRREQTIAAAVFAEMLSVDEGKEALRQLNENEQTRIFQCDREVMTREEFEELYGEETNEC